MNYKVSTIIPVYNVEEYLEETIESVIHQSIGFENIQLILVNDGSPDNSEEICLKYKQLYPNNVLYIKQENAGVSEARNNGLRHASAPYINFLDSDDKWAEEAYEEGIQIFEKNKEVTSVIYPMNFFDAKTGDTVLNFMFKDGKRIINILEDYTNIKLQSCSILFRKEILEGHEFSKELKISEDARFICEVLMENPIVAKAKSIYYYRKRKTETSAIQTSQKKKTWYLDTTEYGYKKVIEESKKKYGKVIRYIQFYILYEFKWRMNVSGNTVLTEEEKNTYIQNLKYCLNEVEDEMINNFKLMNRDEKLYTFNFKYDSEKLYDIKDNFVTLNELKVCPIKNVPIYLDTIYEKDENITIYGRMPIIDNVLDDAYLEDDKGNKYLFIRYDLDNVKRYPKAISEKDNFYYVGFKSVIPLDSKKNLKLIAENNQQRYRVNLVFTYNSSLNNHFDGLYLRTKRYYIHYLKNKIRIKEKTLINKLKLEVKCDLKLLKMKKMKSLAYRLLAQAYQLIKRKEIWIVSDRIQVAGDNGEYFFKYLNTLEHKDKKIYFVISDKSEDYDRLKKEYPNVIAYHSLKHMIYHLNADKIISAHADDYVVNPFGKSKYFIADLYRYKFIFLQHGVIINDLSPWLNVNSKKIDMFFTTAYGEYDSITSGAYRYNYPSEIIKLTGIARFDKLLKKKYELKKQIVIMPTWRKSLTSNINVKTGERMYNPNFINSDYFKFYNSLINNEKLLTTLKDKGYNIKFIPHSNMMSQIKDFTKNDYVEFSNGIVDYGREFIENSCLITDYSSVSFDFSFLKKPIILAQFDIDSFYEGQLYDPGYYDYQTNGFGKVTHTFEETVDEIIHIIENDCIIDQIYLDRINKFYKYFDQNNCERIYSEIIKI